MLVAAEFRTVQVQAVVFTPGARFRGGRILTHLLTQYGDRFDAEPFSLEMPEAVPAEVPRVILKSSDSRLRLQGGPLRLDLFLEGPEVEKGRAIDEFLSWAAHLFIGYLPIVEAGAAARLACLATRVAEHEEPAKAITEHFCKERWLKGPLNRPAAFEVHAHKRFKMGGVIEVNSWFRCKSGTLKRPESESEAPIILVEQDFNTPQEASDTRPFPEEEIRKFFEVAPAELRKVLDLYFPAEESAREQSV